MVWPSPMVTTCSGGANGSSSRNRQTPREAERIGAVGPLGLEVVAAGAGRAGGPSRRRRRAGRRSRGRRSASARPRRSPAGRVDALLIRQVGLGRHAAHRRSSRHAQAVGAAPRHGRVRPRACWRPLYRPPRRAGKPGPRRPGPARAPARGPGRARGAGSRAALTRRKTSSRWTITSSSAPARSGSCPRGSARPSGRSSRRSGSVLPPSRVSTSMGTSVVAPRPQGCRGRGRVYCTKIQNASRRRCVRAGWMYAPDDGELGYPVG